MQTEAGKTQGALLGWGPVSTGYAKRYSNYDIDDSDGPVPLFGTEAYGEFNRWIMQQFPQNFPERLEHLPDVDLNTIKENPAQAVYTYIRTECQRCHLGLTRQGQTGRYARHGLRRLSHPLQQRRFL